jgi:hypothetical protein
LLTAVSEVVLKAGHAAAATPVPLRNIIASANRLPTPERAPVITNVLLPQRPVRLKTTAPHS